MLFPVILASFALGQQVPAPAAPQPAPIVQAEAAPPPTANVPQPAEGVAQVCRTETVTGSRFGRRVCRNAQQTAEERAEGREMLRRMQGSRLPDS